MLSVLPEKQQKIKIKDKIKLSTLIHIQNKNIKRHTRKRNEKKQFSLFSMLRN